MRRAMTVLTVGLLLALLSAAQAITLAQAATEAAETPEATATAAPVDGPVVLPDPTPAELAQWTATLEQFGGLLSNALTWLSGLSVGLFVIVVLALLGAVTLIVLFARRYVPLPIFNTVTAFARDGLSTIKELGEKRLEEAKKTPTPVDDALLQITNTLAGLLLSLLGTTATAATTVAAATVPAGSLTAQVADLQRQLAAIRSVPAASADDIAAQRAWMKYGTPSGMPQWPGGAPPYPPIDDDGGAG
jgi:hypothetical protein